MEERSLEVIKNEKIGNVVSSRTISKQLGKEHKNVLRDLESILSSSKVSHLIVESSYRAKTGTYKEYLLTKDGFTLYMFNIQGHNEFKMAYITKFNELEKIVQQTLSEKDNFLLNIIKSNSETDRALALNRYQVEYVKPLEEKIEVLTHVNKLYTSTEIAKELGYKSATALNKILEEKKVQYKVNNTWVLTSKYSNLGYESIKQTVLDTGKVIYDRKFTQNGRDFILKLLKEVKNEI